MVSVNLTRPPARRGRNTRRPREDDPMNPTGQAPVTTPTGTGTGSADRPSGGFVTGTVAGGIEKAPDVPHNAVQTIDPNPPTGQGSTGGNGPGSDATQPRPGTVYDAPESDIDSLIEENVRKYLTGGQDNTEARNKALADASAAATGRQIVNQRASMGRAGFGASGSLAGLEMDARQAAARSLALDQAAVGEDEQKQQYDRFLGATGADIDKQRLAQEQADADARLAFLKTVVGGDGGAGVTDTGRTDVADGRAEVVKVEGGRELTDADIQHAHNSKLVHRAEIPADATKFAEDSQYDYYEFGDPPRYRRVER